MTEEERDVAEADRVAAEIGRVEAEEDRVDAEAGDGGAALELGRVQAEESRVEAEALREQREDRRRISEGGPDQHVEGNTESGRVEAEEKRQAAWGQMYRRVAFLIALPLALIVAVPVTGGLLYLNGVVSKLDREIVSRCEDAAVNRDAIRSTVLRSFRNLGYVYDEETGKAVPSGAPLAYYALHPEERAEQLQDVLDSIERFPSIDCPN